MEFCQQWVASSQVSTFLSGDKEVRGLYALGFLLLIGLSSARPLRRYSYPVFFTLHYVGIIGFLVYVNSHTIYAQGWATWGIGAIYMVDIAGRLSGMRLRYVEVEALEGGMVRVGMKGLSGGWRGGQHLSMRLFFAPTSRSIFSAFRPIEAHPFSISSAPPTVSVLPPRGIELFIKACAPGSWTADLFDTATIAQRIASSRSTDGKAPVLHMLALIEGPYGGLGYNALEEENVLLVAGGSGMSHVLGVLDETVGRRAKSGKGGRIQVVWAVRDRGQFPSSSPASLTDMTPHSSNYRVPRSPPSAPPRVGRHSQPHSHPPHPPHLRPLPHLLLSLFPHLIHHLSHSHPDDSLPTSPLLHPLRSNGRSPHPLSSLLPSLSLWRIQRRWYVR